MPSIIVGELLRLDLVEPHYKALIERADIATVHMNRYVELWVAPSVVDVFVEQRGEGRLFRFKIENGIIVEAVVLESEDQSLRHGGAGRGTENLAPES